MRRWILCLTLVACKGGDDDTPSTDSAPSTDSDPPAAFSCAKPLFPADAPWNQPIAEAPLDAESVTLLDALERRGGFGNGRVQMDLSIEVSCDAGDAPMLEFTPTEDFYTPDCDLAPVPVPEDAHLEGEDGLACTGDGDCHLIVIHQPTATLYEQWRANIVDGVYEGGCLAIWDMSETPPETLRGEHCTSADAAGLPIAPLLFDADEVAAGEINHAIRFILPNDRLRNRTYVRPATHATGAASAGDDGIPYGLRLRLRADYPLESLPSDGARVVAKALQTYGMILADGGTIALTAQSDRLTTAKWDDWFTGTRDLEDLAVADFEVVEAGERIAWTGDCVRE